MSIEDNKLISENIQVKYHQLKKEDRIKIDTLACQYNDNGKRIFNNIYIYIANVIGVHKSTIGRELKNRIKSKTMVMTGHTRNLPYTADSAQKDYLFKRALSKAEYKLEKYPEMAKFIIEKMRKDKWAPDAIVGFMKKHGYFDKKGFCSITTQAIYYDIRMNVAGVLIISFINPFVMNIINNIPNNIITLIAVILAVLFIVDNIMLFNIICNLKNMTITLKKDSTEDIKKHIKNIIQNNKYLYNRLIKAFPGLKKIIIENKKRIKSKENKRKRKIKKEETKFIVSSFMVLIKFDQLINLMLINCLIH